LNGVRTNICCAFNGLPAALAVLFTALVTKPVVPHFHISYYCLRLLNVFFNFQTLKQAFGIWILQRKKIRFLAFSKREPPDFSEVSEPKKRLDDSAPWNSSTGAKDILVAARPRGHLREIGCCEIGCCGTT
jgi:hypothetical protein